MSTGYNKTAWQDGDVITADKMNNIENGVKTLDDDLGTVWIMTQRLIEEVVTMPITITKEVEGQTPTIEAENNTRYICGEVLSLDITLPASGIVDVVFTSGSTPTVLTITPPTGQTVKWANGFDPENLDADTTYEINVADGLGVAASWT